MWDAETGEVISRFTARKMPFCVKFHPDNNKQHLFVAGTSDKKIICVSFFSHHKAIYTKVYFLSTVGHTQRRYCSGI